MYQFILFFLMTPYLFLGALDFLAYQHRLEEINFKSSAMTLTLDDSSVWEIDKDCLEELGDYQISDPIIITSNKNWLPTKYPFTLVNQRTRNSVNIKNLFCPLIDNPFARSLLSLDLKEPMITLSDQLIFFLEAQDQLIYEAWQEGDFILIGINSEWFSKYRFILINLSTNTYVQANSFKKILNGITAFNILAPLKK